MKKLNILYNLKNNAGQTLIEFLITYIILSLCTFVVIEIARMIAVKNCLQAATSYIAHKISSSQINLIKENIISNTEDISENENKIFMKKISDEIREHMSLISTTLLSFDTRDNAINNGVLSLDRENIRIYLKLVNKAKNLPAGVYLESQSCLPVLFSGLFRRFPGAKQIGKRGNDDTRTCLGNFNSSINLPIYWFKIRVAAYSPWPASTQIFNYGLAIPKKFKKIEEENVADAMNAIKNTNLSQFFKQNYNTKINGWAYE